MPRFTTAYSSFLNRLGEVRILRASAAAYEREDPIGNSDQINALCRGALVLLSAHLEAYVKELGEKILDRLVAKQVDRSKVSPRVFYNISKHFIDEIKDTEDHDGIVTKVFDFLATEAPLWQRTGPFGVPISAEAFNKGFSNPAYKKICAYFNRFGYQQYKAELAQNLGANFLVVTNMVDHLVAVRNKIAHGDQSASKTPTEVREMTLTIAQFCKATDSVFASWCKRGLCGIR